MVICASCEKPQKGFMFYEGGQSLCHNCWATKVVKTVETTIVRGVFGQTLVLSRYTRNRVAIERQPEPDTPVKLTARAS